MTALMNENDGLGGARESLNVPAFVATIAALRSSLSTDLFGIVVVEGSTTVGDGSGGLYWWNATDTTADNGTTVIRPAVIASTSAGRWNLFSAQVMSSLVAGLGQGVRHTSAGATIATTDRGYVVANDGGGTITIPPTATLGNGFMFAVVNADSALSMTLSSNPSVMTPPFLGNGSLTGSTSLTLRPGESAIFAAYAGVYYFVGGSGRAAKPTADVFGVVALIDAATIATNAALGNLGDVTLGASRTLGAPTNPTDGQKFIWRIKQGGTGSYVITWNPAFDWGAGGAPTLSTAVGKVDIVGGIYNGSLGTWQMMPAALGFN